MNSQIVTCLGVVQSLWLFLDLRWDKTKCRKAWWGFFVVVFFFPNMFLTLKLLHGACWHIWMPLPGYLCFHGGTLLLRFVETSHTVSRMCPYWSLYLLMTEEWNACDDEIPACSPFTEHISVFHQAFISTWYRNSSVYWRCLFPKLLGLCPVAITAVLFQFLPVPLM